MLNQDGPARAPGPFGGWPGLVLLWAIATLVALTTRPLIPVDELRYVDVAWEMWSRGDFLVPFLNAAPYSHKPPLFFWLIDAGWWLFGVSEWVARLVTPLLYLLNLWLTARLARLLWPDDAVTARLAPWVLFSCLFLTGFSGWVQIDMLLMSTTLLSLAGVLLAARGRGAGWLLAGAGIGVGVLAKGPVILVHVLPVAWLAPLWREPVSAPRWPAWYAGSVFSVLTGACLALAWAWPAAQAGGEAYREAIFWGQTAHRVVASFAHAHPWWWYLPWLPVLFAPWIALPWLWRALGPAWRRPDGGLRFCASWLLATVLLLSLVSGKQAKYLLPMLPAFALLVARVLAGLPRQPAGRRPWPVVLVLALLGVVFMIAPLVLHKAAWLNEVSPVWGAVLVLLALLLWFMPAQLPQHYPQLMALLTVAMLSIGEIGVLRIGAPSYDLKAASRLIAQAQAERRPVAVAGSYHGEFGFYGRLRAPVREIGARQAHDWLRTHARGYLVLTDKTSSAGMPGVLLHQPYQSGYLAIVDAEFPAY